MVTYTWRFGVHRGHRLLLFACGLASPMGLDPLAIASAQRCPDSLGRANEDTPLVTPLVTPVTPLSKLTPGGG